MTEKIGRIEKSPISVGPRKPGQAQPANGWCGAAPKKKALDSAKRERMHRALDAVMDARAGRARDSESGPYDVGYMPKGGDPKGTWRDVVITASSWNDAMSKAKAGVRSGEELYRVSPRDKSAPWAK